MFNSWASLANESGLQSATPGNLDLSPQYDPNGYMAQFTQPQQQNPYSNLIAQGGQMAGLDSRAAQNPQSNLDAQNQNYAQYLAQSYPSYPNAAGAGNQMMGQNTPQVPGTGVMGNGTQAQPTYASQSFNPWSLTGENMSRVK